MTDVYVDVSAASVDGNGAPDSGGPGGSPAAEAEAVRALRYLGEAGLRVVLVAPDGVRPTSELRAVAAEIVGAPPAQRGALAWYLTSDMARCGGASARLRTVLIGGSQPSGAVRRCDATARDIQAAAMEILAAVAMPPRANTTATEG